METLLRFLLTEPAEPCVIESVDDAWRRHRALASRFPVAVDLAAAAGFGSDRLGYAFMSGYQAALAALLPERATDRLTALCATEQGGGRPSAIRTSLTRGRDGELTLSGTKSFVTLGSSAQRLIVVASEGADEAGRNRLRVVVVDSAARGAQVRELPQLGFIPEIPHAELILTDVRVAPDDVLDGDGYLLYLKPFRTLEDVHVFAAVFGWLLRVARSVGWPSTVQERILATIVALRSIAIDDPTSPAIHVAFGGVFAQAGDVLTAIEPLWPVADATTRSRWERDRPLLAIAGKVRAMRLEAAWRELA